MAEVQPLELTAATTALIVIDLQKGIVSRPGEPRDLDLQLRRRGIRTLILCGIATCFGVESTARDAYERAYQQVFVEDAMTSRSAAEHEHTVTRIFPRMGRVRRTAEVVAALR